MFKFNFDVDDIEDVAEVAEGGESAHIHRDGGQGASISNTPSIMEQVSREITVDELIAALPPAISFSPLSIPLSTDREVVLSRRDLFDARFQLISNEQSGTKEGPPDIDFVDALSDLLPGVYEGGLKTWECSLDLVDCLDSIHGNDIASRLRGKRILELGCGTAVPSLYLLYSLFSAGSSPECDVHIHLQDYNELVLRLVTLPNIILAWYMSPASSAYRSTSTPSAGTEKYAGNKDDMDEADPLPPADATETGELPITPALTAAFLKSLQACRIHLKFFEGGWATFDVDRAGGNYDILLTSETIYRPASLESLVDLIRRATAGRRSDGETFDIEAPMSRLMLSCADGGNLTALAAAPYLCLVAAKLVYFGVGGGVNEFVEVVERSSGKVQSIWERSRGVRRRIMRVVWKIL